MATGTPPPDAPPPPPALVPGLRWRRVLPGDERQLAVLRRWVATVLPESPARDDVTTVANELASNAIKHTASGYGGWFAAELTWYGPVVRVAVADSGGPGDPHVIDDPAGDHGRGLLLVRGLAVRTGVSGDRRGRLVWADVRWEHPGAGASAAAPEGYEVAIREGQAALDRRFAGVPAWFGRATLAWWAFAEPAGLVTAPTARELAGLLYRLLDAPAPGGPAAHLEALGPPSSGVNLGHRYAGVLRHGPAGVEPPVRPLGRPVAHPMVGAGHG